MEGVETCSQEKTPSNLRQLQQFAQEESTKVPVDRCRGHIESHRNRLIKVIASLGCANINIKLRVAVFFFFLGQFNSFVKPQFKSKV